MANKPTSAYRTYDGGWAACCKDGITHLVPADQAKEIEVDRRKRNSSTPTKTNWPVEPYETDFNWLSLP